MVGVLYWWPIGHSHRNFFSFGVEDTYFCRLVHKWFQKHLLETVAFKGLENFCSVSTRSLFTFLARSSSQFLEVSFSLLSPKLLFRAFQVAGERQNASPPPFTSPLSLRSACNFCENLALMLWCFHLPHLRDVWGCGGKTQPLSLYWEGDSWATSLEATGCLRGREVTLIIREDCYDVGIQSSWVRMWSGIKVELFNTSVGT